MATTVKFVTVPSKTLASSINSSAMSIQLSDIQGWNGVDLTSADFGDVLWAVLRDSTNTFMEIIQLDPTTIAASSITILKRGLDFSGGSVEVTANKLTWIKNDTIIELGSNPPQLLGQAVAVSGNQTIADLKTFTTLPQSTATPTDSKDFATKAYTDLVAGGTANYDQNIVAGVAGEALTAALVAYLKASDGKWYVADSATASKSVGVKIGIIQATVTSGSACRILLAGRDKTQTGLTAGLVYYLGVAGVLSTTKGANIRIIGQVPNGSTTDLVTSMESSGDPEVALTDGSRSYVLDTGAANAYVATMVPAISAYKAGQKFTFKAVNANTTVSTLNVNGLGVKTIKKADGATDLAAGDIAAGQIVEVVYDGTNMQMKSAIGNAPATVAYVNSLRLGGVASDGSAVLDGTNTFAWASKSGSTYTLTRDVNLINLTVNAGVILETANFKLYGTGTLNNAGTIKNTATPGSSITGGINIATGTLGVGGPGGNGGGPSVGPGLPGSAGGNVLHALGGSGALGVTGGGGGSAVSGAIGTVTAPSVVPNLLQGLFMFDSTTTGIFGYTGGAGGAGGGGGSNTVGFQGGGGGAGGNIVYINFFIVINSGTISAIGGAAGTRGGDGGGGGGGGGGSIVIITTSHTNSGTETVAGGAGTNGGATGSTGNIYIILVTTI